MPKKLSTEELVAKKDQMLLKRPRNQVFLILDNIRSMYNVGAMFRTADAARVEKIYLCGITATPPRKEIEKTALKTIKFVPWEHRDNTESLVTELRDKGIQVVALEQTDQSISYRNFYFHKPVAIIVGHEVNGVSDNLLELCDGIVEIPMHGIANSLNVATATGIILYYLIN